MERCGGLREWEKGFWEGFEVINLSCYCVRLLRQSESYDFSLAD